MESGHSLIKIPARGSQELRSGRPGFPSSFMDLGFSSESSVSAQIFVKTPDFQGAGERIVRNHKVFSAGSYFANCLTKKGFPKRLPDENSRCFSMIFSAEVRYLRTLTKMTGQTGGLDENLNMAFNARVGCPAALRLRLAQGDHQPDALAI